VSVIAHEAAHASAAVALGLPVLSVSVQPDELTLGRVKVAYAGTGEDTRKRMLVIVAPFVHDAATSNDLPRWPLTGTTTDERNLRRLAAQLNLTERGYRDVLSDAVDLVDSPGFKAMHALTVKALEANDGHLDADELDAIEKEARLEGGSNLKSLVWQVSNQAERGPLQVKTFAC
jgi:hypothetical protein